MKLTFKIYQQPDADFEIDAEASETIGDLKAKIKDAKDYEVEKQNIIFCGKGLANDKTLESYKISGKGFLVLSISRPRPPLPVPRQLDAEEYFALTEEELAHFPLGPPPTASVPDPGATSTSVPPTTSASTFKYVPMSPPKLDTKTTSTPAPPTTSASTFKYVPMSASSPAPVPAATSHIPPTTSASTFKYIPMSTSALGSETTSTPVPPPTSVSTFKYVPLSASSSSSTSTSASASTSVPQATSTSTFKYVPMSSSTSPPASSSASASSSKSTFKHVPMSTSSRVPGSTSTGVSSTPPAGQPQRLSQRGTALGAGMIPTAGSSGSANVANDPQIAQFRQLVTQNPEMRQRFIQQVAQDNPELGQLLTQNPDLLLQFLDTIEEGGGAGSGGTQGVRVSVTEAEHAAIQRLEALGFPKQAVLEAYFACDKNEELAANYLIENA